MKKILIFSLILIFTSLPQIKTQQQNQPYNTRKFRISSKMRSKRNHSKKSQEMSLIPKNQSLLNFIKVEKPNSNAQEKIRQPKINIPRFIRMPNSSGETPKSYPEDIQILYPKNPELREYQFQISMECIKYNTLVCLPTGLGKTHIASILIMNFTIWYPQGKIFFLAPTRPLVRQQRQSLKWFYQKIGVQNVFEMNGQLAGPKREKLYQTKRVFFATPQTFTNDLKENRIDAQKIKLIIFDQAHRAVGNSAYAESIRFLNKLSLCYRIIGLSATPGNQKDKIQQVITNLNISKMLYKDEQQPDVKKYFFNKMVVPLVIDPPSIIQEVQSILDNMVTPYLRYLISMKIADPWVLKSKISSGLFFIVFKSFNQKKNILDSTNSQFAYATLRILKFLIDSKQDLIQHGYETFKSKFFRQIETMVLDQTEQETETNGVDSKVSKNSKNSRSIKLPSQSLPKKFRQKIIESQGYKRIKELFNPKSNLISHPKLQKLRNILDEFFKVAFKRLPSQKITDPEIQPKPRNSKCIVFTHYRSTAHEIKNYLSGSSLIKPELFHGQSKTHIYEDRYDEMGQYENSKQSTLVLNQKQQISIIQRFKQGQINTLIATSIGEQGLDIGEVDCIVCYDGGNKSPIRSIQRFGRTGRKRDGIVYVLLMKGGEEADYKSGQNKIKIMKKMLKDGEFVYYSFNVSLLRDQSEVPIVVYENKITEPVASEKKQKVKRGRKKKKDSNQDKDQSNGEEDEKIQEIDQFIEPQCNKEISNQPDISNQFFGQSLTNTQYLEKLFKDELQDTYYIDDIEKQDQEKRDSEIQQNTTKIQQFSKSYNKYKNNAKEKSNKKDSIKKNSEQPISFQKKDTDIKDTKKSKSKRKQKSSQKRQPKKKQKKQKKKEQEQSKTIDYQQSYQQTSQKFEILQQKEELPFRNNQFSFESCQKSNLNSSKKMNKISDKAGQWESPISGVNKITGESLKKQYQSNINIAEKLTGLFQTENSNRERKVYAQEEKQDYSKKQSLSRDDLINSLFQDQDFFQDLVNEEKQSENLNKPMSKQRKKMIECMLEQMFEDQHSVSSEQYFQHIHNEIQLQEDTQNHQSLPIQPKKQNASKQSLIEQLFQDLSSQESSLNSSELIDSILELKQNRRISQNQHEQ